MRGRKPKDGQKMAIFQMRLLTNFEKWIYFITIAVVILMAGLHIVPMIILQDNYIFAVHDGLDSYAGWVKIFRDGGFYFNMNQTIPFLGGSWGAYVCMTYNLYDFLNCTLGFLPGQICTRVIGIVAGYFSMRRLLNYMFPKTDVLQKCLFSLISILYTIMPCAPNRTIALAFLPLIFNFFLILKNKEKFTKLVFFALLIPIVSNFATLLVFTIALWFVGCIVLCIIERRPNINLILALILMGVMSIPVNISYFLTAFTAQETNRSLLYATIDPDWISHFKNYLLNGQYHAPGMHGYFLLPMLMLFSTYFFSRYRKNTECKDGVLIKTVIVIVGWMVWVLSAFIMAYQEGGFKTGFLLIDGMGWGRMIAQTRFWWCLMLGIFVDSLPDTESFSKRRQGIFRGLLAAGVICVLLSLLFGEIGLPAVLTFYDNYPIRKLMDAVKLICYISIAAVIFYSNSRRLIGCLTGLVILFQIFYVNIAINEYNDVAYTMSQYVIGYNDISMRKFFSESLFEEIKEDMNYNGEWVAAYGYHPSVLEYNGFRTLDGYESVHSMEYQIKFREIIAPALERYENWRNYYDGWGGRMYLYGELPYTPWAIKEVEPVPLYINVRAFNQLGGKYILSRAEISNADELGLSFINDYDREDSLYHIFLYRTDLNENAFLP